MDKTRVEFSPTWAPHVKGWHTLRDEDGVAHWGATCAHCKATAGPVACTSGLLRQHINKFALAHVHRAPLT